MVTLAAIAALALPTAASPVPAAAAATCPVSASFSPSRGDPATLRVRFTVRGFQPGHPVYLHYLAPGRRFVLTVGLGFASGRCGTLVSSRRRLFPFRHLSNGDWRLQFDEQGRYHRRPSRPFVVLLVPVLRG
jgi:hypothetical protein